MTTKLETSIERERIAGELAEMAIQQDYDDWVTNNVAEDEAIPSLDEVINEEEQKRYHHDSLKGIGQILVARRMILRRNPYFSTIMMGMEFQLTADNYIAKTNGKVIVFNPLIVASSLDQPQTNALVLHELLHNILMHSFRRGNLDIQHWNVAADLVVNHTIDTFFSEEVAPLQRQGYRHRGKTKPAMPIRLPPNALLTPGAVNKLTAMKMKGGLKGWEEGKDRENALLEGKFDRMLEEFQELMGQVSLKHGNKGTMISGPSTNRVFKSFKEIYDLIQLQPPEDSPPGDCPGDGPGGGDEEKPADPPESSMGWGDETGDELRIISLYKGMGEVEDYSANDSQNLRQAQITATLVQKAAMMAVSHGMSAEDPARQLAVTMENEFTPEIPWKQQFRNIVMDITRKEDYTWRRPNKKWMQQNIYMPSIQGPQDEKSIVVGIDVSGSIGQRQLKLMAEELSNSLSDIAFKAHIVMCDTAIKKVVELSNEDLPFNIDVEAGGGTMLSPIFMQIAEQQWAPILTVMFTDMEFNWTSLRQTYYEVGGEQTCGDVVFLNFGRPIVDSGNDQYGYRYAYSDEFKDPFYANIIDMERNDAKEQKTECNLIAEPLTKVP
jgi:predicted metal-dependent peptidase